MAVSRPREEPRVWQPCLCDRVPSSRPPVVPEPTPGAASPHRGAPGGTQPRRGPMTQTLVSGRHPGPRPSHGPALVSFQFLTVKGPLFLGGQDRAHSRTPPRPWGQSRHAGNWFWARNGKQLCFSPTSPPAPPPHLAPPSPLLSEAPPSLHSHQIQAISGDLSFGDFAQTRPRPVEELVASPRFVLAKKKPKL